jgi:hypothetical protein
MEAAITKKLTKNELKPFFGSIRLIRSAPGLPDGLFSNQKSQFG